MQITDSKLSPSEYGENTTDDEMWQKLYAALHQTVSHWVFTSHVATWHGQESVIVDDIVSMAIERVFKRMQQVESGNASPIASIWGFARRVAYCDYIDMVRHDHRLITVEQAEVERQEQESPLDKATEAAFRESLFKQVATEVANFPAKQRDALLIDLANRMDFDPQAPTPLQQAFAAAGIDLQEYRRVLSSNHVERARHASILNHAYRRIAALPSVRLWSSIA